MNLTRLAAWDAILSKKLRLGPENKLAWRISVFFAHSGDSWFWMAGLGMIWLIDWNQWHSRAALLGISVVVLAVLVLGIKFIVRRQRPPGEWGAIYRNTDPHSFPSGHAARSFMLAALAFGLGPQWFAVLLLVWAPLVSLARVATGVHYISDVIAGGILGVLAGKLFLWLAPWVEKILFFLF